MSDKTETKDPNKRAAIWCDGEVVRTIRATAAMRGESVREYMRTLVERVKLDGEAAAANEGD